LDSTAERLESQVADQIAELDRRFSEGASEVEALVAKLPKKLQSEVVDALNRMRPISKSSRDFHKQVLVGTKERLVTEATLELDATISGAITRLGLHSLSQLAVTTDPNKSQVQLIAQDQDTL
jgi:hypothetical protein